MKPRILIVEDDAAVISSLNCGLGDQFEFHSANDIGTAIRLLSQLAFSIILMDHQKMEEAGSLLVDTAKTFHADTMGVIVSGYNDISGLVDALNLSYSQNYIPKPCSIELLRSRLEEDGRQYLAIINDRQLLHNSAEIIRQNKEEIDQLREMMSSLADGRMDRLLMGSELTFQNLPSETPEGIQAEYKYLDRLVDGFAILDKSGKLTYANDSFLNLLELNNWPDFADLPLRELPIIQSHPELVDSLTAVNRGEYVLAEIRWNTPSGNFYYLELTASPVHEQERNFGAVLVIRDQTSRLRTIAHLSGLNAVAEALASSLNLPEMLPAAMRSSKDALYADGSLLYIHIPELNAMQLEYADGVSAETIQYLQEHSIPADKGFIGQIMETGKPAAQDLLSTGQLIYPSLVRSERITSLAAAPLIVEEKIIGVIEVFTRQRRRFTAPDLRLLTSIANQVALVLRNTQLHQQVVEQSRTDPLTGLFNRRYFHERVERETKASIASGHPFTLLMVDIDNFKSINDRFGHLTGDRVLQQVASQILASVRMQDVVARYGGDEFIILLQDVDNETVEKIIQRLSHKVEQIQLPEPGGAKEPVSLSIGKASLQLLPPEDFESLLNRVDTAMYSKKPKNNTGTVVNTRINQYE